MSDEVGSFGSLLRNLRLRANLTHEALAARSGLSVDAISMLERGVRHTPRRSTVVALVQALRPPPDAREALFAAARRPDANHSPMDLWPVRTCYPQTVGDDWREAHVALAAGLVKAAAALARRAVQGVCVDKMATAGIQLYDQIKELGQTHTLHPTLVESALQIPLFGSAAASVPLDGLDNVTQEDAATVVAFLDELLLLTYEVPDRLAKVRASVEV